MNDYYNDNGYGTDYDYNYNYVEEKPKSKGLSIASLVCGIVCLFCNGPLYIINLAALILGIVALATKSSGKGMAITGIILSVLSVLIWVTIDTLASIFSMGMGSFLFFF